MKKTKLVIFAISSTITYFLFHAARASAIAERGSSTAIGGEYLLLLLPLIVLIIYDNIVLTHKVTIKSKQTHKPKIKMTTSRRFAHYGSNN